MRGAQETVEGVLAGWAERLAGDDWGAGAAWGALFGDALCRRLIMRFLLCRAVLALHTGLSRAPELQPTCFPALPEVRAPQERIGDIAVDDWRPPCNIALNM